MFLIENSGTYKLVNKTNGKYYPGSSQYLLSQKGVNGRKYQHFYMLRKKIHHCEHLQNAYNSDIRDGKLNNYEFIIIKTHIPENQLIIEEQLLLDVAKTEPEKCYTKNFTAYRIDMNEQTKKKISNNHADFKGKNHPRYGTKQSKKEIQKRIDTFIKNGKTKGKNNPRFNNTIYTFKNQITNEIFKGTKYEFRIKFNLCRQNIDKIINGKYKYSQNWIFILDCQT